MVVPETNCVGNQLYGRMESVRPVVLASCREGMYHKDMFPGKIPDFPSCRPLRKGWLAPPLSFLTSGVEAMLCKL